MLMPMGQLQACSIESMGIKAKTLSMPGTKGRCGYDHSWEEGASLIVAVGTHSNMVDFSGEGTQRHGQHLLIRLKVGSYW